MHRTWAESEGYEFGLLSDFWPHGEVAKAYGVFDDERGIATRGTFIIDKTGVVRWKVVNAIPQARDLAEYQKALAELELAGCSRACGLEGSRIGTGGRCPVIAVAPGRSILTAAAAPGCAGSGPTARC